MPTTPGQLTRRRSPADCRPLHGPLRQQPGPLPLSGTFTSDGRPLLIELGGSAFATGAALLTVAASIDGIERAWPSTRCGRRSRPRRRHQGTQYGLSAAAEVCHSRSQVLWLENVILVTHEEQGGYRHAEDSPARGRLYDPRGRRHGRCGEARGGVDFAL